MLSSLNSQATVKDFEALNLACGNQVTAMLNGRVNNKHQVYSDPTKLSDNLKQADLIGISDPDKYDLMVAKVWGQVLGKLELHIDDSFNDLGGNSMTLFKNTALSNRS